MRTRVRKYVCAPQPPLAVVHAGTLRSNDSTLHMHNARDLILTREHPHHPPPSHPPTRTANQTTPPSSNPTTGVLGVRISVILPRCTGASARISQSRIRRTNLAAAPGRTRSRSRVPYCALPQSKCGSQSHQLYIRPRLHEGGGGARVPMLCMVGACTGEHLHLDG